VSGDNRYYYTDVWAGLRTMLNTARDYNIRFVELPYNSGGQGDEISPLLEHVKVDGIISVGYLDNRGKLPLDGIIKHNIPVSLVTNDVSLPSRLCCVQPDYPVTGRMLAEFICPRIPAGGGILIHAGDGSVPSQYLMVQGFETYLAEKGLSNPLYKIYSEGGKEQTRRRLAETLRDRPVAACAGVNARGSILLAEALEEAGMAGKITAVGSDLFSENFAYLRKGVFSSLLNKNSFMQAYIATKCMIEYLLRNISPPMETIFVGSEIVFQSNAAMYQHGADKLFL
jgi:LacI family transcriptional regulator